MEGSFILILLSLPAVQAHTPCCRACNAPKRKYFSIADDSGPWLCGETCIQTWLYPLFHAFERNLTLAESDTVCSDAGYTDYVETVTHGAPPLTCTLDLYACPRGACPHPA